MRLAYVFECKGIQAYLAQGGRLADALGASLLVDSLCGGALLDRTLVAAGIAPGACRFTRRAAGAFAFVLTTPGAAAALPRFRALWTLAVQHAAPGLGFIEMTGQGATAQAALEDALAQALARRAILPVALPPGLPLNLVSPRTGGVAVWQHGLRLPAELTEAEREERTRRDAAQLRKAGMASDPDHREELADRFRPAGAPEGIWPRDMEAEFPFQGEDGMTGLLHVDVNDMGRQLKMLAERHPAGPAPAPGAPLTVEEDAYLAALWGFSQGVEAALQAAARQAGQLLAKAHADDRAAAEAEGVQHGEAAEAARRKRMAYLPARPILLGGDDVLILLRADLALDYAETFLAAFAAAAEAAREGALGGATVTASAGLLLAGGSRPFAQAVQLAGSLCRHAKAWGKKAAPNGPTPSALSFDRATANLPETYEEPTHKGDFPATLNPYLLAPIGSMGEPRYTLGALRALCDALAAPGLRGTARELSGLLLIDLRAAELRYNRWLDVLRERDGPEGGPCKDMLEALDRLGFQRPSDGHPHRLVNAESRSPWGDALAWLAVTRRADA
jgi:hypothetical protein